MNRKVNIVEIKRKITHCIGFCLFFLQGLTVVAQNAPEGKPKLVVRYENGEVLYRLGEDVLSLTLSVPPNEREKVAIRLCSKEPLAFALPTASASPFEIASALNNKFAYSQNHIIYLRSKDCVSTRNPTIPVTETWAIPESGPLPSYDEAVTASQVKLSSMGRLTAYPGMRDYQVAIRKLIKELKANPNSVGIVLGYFFSRPSPILQSRLRDAKASLGRSGLSEDRYLVRSKLWDDESSQTDSEPVYPSVFVVEIASQIR